MSLDSAERRAFLKQGNFASLLTQTMGWDRFTARASVAVGDESFVLSPVAEKRGVQVFAITGEQGKMPPSATRRKIEREVTKIAAEHLLIFHDGPFKEQIWQWVAREPHKPAQVREIALHANQSGEALLQKLDRISFALPEEESLSIVAVATKLKDAFDRDKVTKKFYERFQKEHTAFHDLIAGITTGDNDKRWYTSVMINRIMFLYFVQSKGFLNRELDYLKNRLEGSAKKYGKDQFYQGFLCSLFFEGLAKREAERSAAVRADLGKLPYLSGSLFVEHEIEARNTSIDIPDAAFEKLLGFLGEYNWHLDERPIADGRHINPDVLGYIFEKYINQKQMGAYYTKEDITEYISKNTILPFVLEQTKEKCEVAFAGEYSVWRLLSEDPDRYIYPAVRKGVDNSLPANIEAGISDVSKRGDWNQSAPSSHALPTEIWRETVARRQRYAEVKGKLERGEVTSVSDLITLNLDIRQFVQDVAERSEGADLLRAVWETLNGNKAGTVPPLSVLDPTCGSGAFLFAAVEILQPLYTACVERMRGFVEDADRVGRPKDHQSFRDALAEMAKHPSEPYFILKKIITHNLFGVDIMDEATEICKLRLFLKLAAQVEPDESKENLGIEPLPDIDFNIRAGNTLIGFATEKQMHNAVSFGGANTTGSLPLEGEDEKWRKFKADLEAYDGLFGAFLEMQERGDFASAFAEKQKVGLRAKLQPLRDQADTLIGHQYGKISTVQRKDWKATAKPFHWFVEFYRTLRAGGFDCIIGNPPYLDFKDLKDYTPKGYETLATRNLYAVCLERFSVIHHFSGWQGVIVPVSSVSSEGYLTLQKSLLEDTLYFSNFDDRPSHLFDGLDKNTLSVLVSNKNGRKNSSQSSRLNRWMSAERDGLFCLLQYQKSPNTSLPGCLPKIGSEIEAAIWSKIFSVDKPMASAYVPISKHVTYYSRKVNSFLQVLDFIPEVRNGLGELRPPSEFKTLTFATSNEAKSVFCCLNSSLFRWYIDVVSDGSHLNKRDIDNFPFSPSRVVQHENLKFAGLKLTQALQKTSEVRVMRYKHDTLTVQCIIPKHSKPIIDEIDRLLAVHYGLSDRQLDFIINYDIKYRLGGTSWSDNEE